LKANKGTTSIENTLIIGVVVLVSISALIMLGKNIHGLFYKTTSKIIQSKSQNQLAEAEKDKSNPFAFFSSKTIDSKNNVPAKPGPEAFKTSSLENADKATLMARFPSLTEEEIAELQYSVGTESQYGLTNVLDDTPLITGTDGEDRMNGTGGNDRYDGGRGNDLIDGSNGDDILAGGPGNDRLNGGADDDILLGGTGNDVLFGDNGDDVIQCGEGDDSADGGKKDDIIHGGPGDDHLNGNNGNDEIHGGPGDDRLYGGRGNDLIFGDEGNDTISGGNGEDEIHGGIGNDRIFGQNDSDTIIVDSSGQFNTRQLLDGGRGMDNIVVTVGDGFLNTYEVITGKHKDHVYLYTTGNAWQIDYTLDGIVVLDSMANILILADFNPDHDDLFVNDVQLF
jgi:Ca2+-binding RTX toxin-like protein/Flp pilus assembly pilin Flp